MNALLDDFRRRKFDSYLVQALGSLTILIVLIMILYPALVPARIYNHNPTALSRLRQVSISLLNYAGENNDSLPPSARWADLAEPYSKSQRTIFRMPETEPGAYSVAFIRRLGGTKPIENEAERQALVYETTDTKWNANHNFTQVWWHRHRRTAVVFVDGHAREFRYYDPRVPAAGTGRLP